MEAAAKTIADAAKAFFDALEGGKDWEVCRQYCHPGATFACEADMLADVKTVEGYAAWVRGLFTPVPDMHPEICTFSTDLERQAVTITAIVHGTQTGPGGPVPPTGKTVAADYVYVLQFEGEKIRHMTKIWNDGYTLKLLGWA